MEDRAAKRGASEMEGHVFCFIWLALSVMRLVWAVDGVEGRREEEFYGAVLRRIKECYNVGWSCMSGHGNIVAFTWTIKFDKNGFLFSRKILYFHLKAN